ncbi:MAG: nitroreductase [Flavobacterium sp.]|jgi:nitroreductase
MSNFITDANWRYATKKFDASKEISDSDLNIIKDAIRLSASSYGLQPYQVFFVKSKEVKEQLLPASWNQSQIVDAQYVVVFANKLSLSDADIDAYGENIVKTRNLKPEEVSGYVGFMKTTVANMPEELRNIWTSKQTYIALTNLLNVASELKIDTTPMEGFSPEEYNRILGLTEKGLNAAVVATIGYRHQEDTTQHFPKVRKSNEDLFITI